jgi:hypothetical protein
VVRGGVLAGCRREQGCIQAQQWGLLVQDSCRLQQVTQAHHHVIPPTHALMPPLVHPTTPPSSHNPLLHTPQATCS